MADGQNYVINIAQLQRVYCIRLTGKLNLGIFVLLHHLVFVWAYHPSMISDTFPVKDL